MSWELGFTGEIFKGSNKSYDVAINNEKTCIFSSKKKKKSKRRRENSICNNWEEPFHNKEISVWTGIIEGIGPLYSGSQDISSSSKKLCM